MNNKGFTLIELLAVIVILGVIALVSVPAILSSINSSRKSACLKQKEEVEKAAYRWGVDNWKDVSNYIDSSISIDVLKESGYLKSDLKNPIDKKKLEGNVKIEYDNNQYKYTYDLYCG